MHLQAPGAAPGEVKCAECDSLFTPRKPWQVRCSKKCRNAFHGRERRRRAIEARALVLFQALCMVRELIRGEQLEHVVVNFPAEPAEGLGSHLDKALKDLKAP